MTGYQDIDAMQNVAILRTKTGAIDYAAYDVRARRERAKAFAAAMAFLRTALGVRLAKTTDLPAQLTAPKAGAVHSC